MSVIYIIYAYSSITMYILHKLIYIYITVIKRKLNSQSEKQMARFYLYHLHSHCQCLDFSFDCFQTNYFPSGKMFRFVAKMLKMFMLSKMCVSSLSNFESKTVVLLFWTVSDKMHADLINSAKDFLKGKISGLVITHGHAL